MKNACDCAKTGVMNTFSEMFRIAALLVFVSFQGERATACNFTGVDSCLKTNTADQLFKFNPFRNTYSSAQIITFCSNYSAVVSCLSTAEVNCSFADLLSIPSSPPGYWKGTFDAFNYLCSDKGKQDYLLYQSCQPNNCSSEVILANRTCSFYKAQFSCTVRATQSCSGTQFLNSFVTRLYQPSLSMLFNCTLAPLSFTSFPNDTSVSVGSNATFRCQPALKNSTLSWYKYETNRRILLYAGATNYNRNSTKYNVVILSGNSTLIIRNAQLTDGSSYSCQTDPDTGEAFANLIVAEIPVGSINPRTTLVIGATVVVTCSTNVGGPTATDAINPLYPTQFPDLRIQVQYFSLLVIYTGSTSGAVLNITRNDQSVIQITLSATLTTQQYNLDFGTSFFCNFYSQNLQSRGIRISLPIKGCTWIPFSNLTSSLINFQPKITSLVDCQLQCLMSSQASCYSGVDWFPDNPNGQQCSFSGIWLPPFNNYDYVPYPNGQYLYFGTHYHCFRDDFGNSCNKGVFDSCTKLLQIWTNKYADTYLYTLYNLYNPSFLDPASHFLQPICSILRSIVGCFNTSECQVSAELNTRNISFLLDAYKFGCSQMAEFRKLENCLLSYSTVSSVPHCYDVQINDKNPYWYFLLSNSLDYDSFSCNSWTSAAQCFLHLPERCGSTDFIKNFFKLFYGGSYVESRFSCNINSTSMARPPNFCDADWAADCAMGYQIYTPPPQYVTIPSIIGLTDQICNSFYSLCLNSSGCIIGDPSFKVGRKGVFKLDVFSSFVYGCDRKAEFYRMLPCSFNVSDGKYDSTVNYVYQCRPPRQEGWGPWLYFGDHPVGDMCSFFHNELICQIKAYELNQCGSTDFIMNYFSIVLNPEVSGFNCTYDLSEICSPFQSLVNSSCIDVAPSFPNPELRGPTVINRTWIEFSCVLNLTSTTIVNYTDILFDVTFLFDGKQMPDIPTVTISADVGKVTLPERKLVDKLNQMLCCSMVSYWTKGTTTQKSANVTSNCYWIGILSKSDSPYVNEGSSDPVTVQLFSTLPITCASPTEKSRNCSLPVEIQSSSGILASKCSLTFIETDWKPQESPTRAYSDETAVYVYARRDLYNAGFRPNYLFFSVPMLPKKVAPDGSTYNDIWSNYSPPFLSLYHVDAPLGVCTSTGDPHVETFDSKYYFYNIYTPGQFVYVKSSACIPFEVQVRHSPCGSVACVCGVAVREHDYILGADMCSGNLHYITYPGNGAPATLPYGYGITRSTNGGSFTINLPSGNIVKGYDIFLGRMNIEIYVTPASFGNILEGLCGSYDDDISNDLKIRGTNNYLRIPTTNTIVGAISPSFTESWRVPGGQSLFDGYFSIPDLSNCTKMDTSDIFCTCQTDSPSCSQSLADKNTVFNYQQQDVSPKIPHTTNMNRKRRRRSPDPLSVSDDIDYTYNSRAYEYTYPDNSSNTYVFSWPTKSGINESFATSYCSSGVWYGAVFKRVCNSSVDQQDIDGILAKCIGDIQISDDLSFARDKIAEMQSLCVFKTATQTINSGPDTNTTNSTNTNTLADLETILSSITEVLAVMCNPSDCNGHGTCVNGTCVCQKDYIGSDCAVSRSQTPSITSLEFNLCDVETMSCLSVNAKTSNVADVPTLICKVEVYKGDSLTPVSYTTNASIITSWSTSCGLPIQALDSFSHRFNFQSVAGSDFKAISPGNPLLIYNISISNDGKNYSNVQSMRVFDSLCYSCGQQSQCIQMNDACLINGYCFGPGDANPLSNLSDTCIPSNSNNSWTTALIAKFRMKDKNFISNYTDLDSNTSRNLSSVVCDSFKKVIANKTDADLKGCKVRAFTNGSVITDTQLDFANNKGTTNTLVDQVAKSINDDFNSNSGVFKSNLNSVVDGLTVAALGSSPQAPTGSGGNGSGAISTTSTGLIIGCVVGGLVGIGLLVTVIAVIAKRRSSSGSSSDDDSVDKSGAGKVGASPPEKSDEQDDTNTRIQTARRGFRKEMNPSYYPDYAVFNASNNYPASRYNVRYLQKRNN